jgi:hypothetical protein
MTVGVYGGGGPKREKIGAPIDPSIPKRDLGRFLPGNEDGLYSA